MKRVFAVLALAGWIAPVASGIPFPDGKWWKRPRIAAEIGLSAEQAREIDQIFLRSRSRLIDLRAALEKKQLALQESMENRTADRHLVERQIEAVENARAGLQKARALMILDMKQVLRPEQWDRLLELRQQVRDRVRSRREGLDGPAPEDRPVRPPGHDR